MIVIKTANGDRFINEAEVKAVKHDKQHALVLITYKDGTMDGAYQVESMYYTNKAETEVRDNGLVLGGVTTDKEYWKEMAHSAEEYVKRLVERRGELEYFITSRIKKPEEGSYEERFINEIRDAQRDRPGSYSEELRQYRDYPYFQKVREDSHLKGDETEKAFTRLTKEIEKITDENRRHREAFERIMKRNLWQRIVNKGTYL